MVLRGQDAWRAHPILKWGAWDLIPGLRQGVGAFAVYVAAEFVYSNAGAPKHGAHGAAHDSHEAQAHKEMHDAHHAPAHAAPVAVLTLPEMGISRVGDIHGTRAQRAGH